MTTKPIAVWTVLAICNPKGQPIRYTFSEDMDGAISRWSRTLQPHRHKKSTHQRLRIRLMIEKPRWQTRGGRGEVSYKTTVEIKCDLCGKAELVHDCGPPGQIAIKDPDGWERSYGANQHGCLECMASYKEQVIARDAKMREAAKSIGAVQTTYWAAFERDNPKPQSPLVGLARLRDERDEKKASNP